MHDTDGFMTTIVSPLADQRKKIFSMDCEMVTLHSWSLKTFIKSRLLKLFVSFPNSNYVIFFFFSKLMHAYAEGEISNEFFA